MLTWATAIKDILLEGNLWRCEGRPGFTLESKPAHRAWAFVIWRDCAPASQIGRML